MRARSSRNASTSKAWSTRATKTSPLLRGSRLVPEDDVAVLESPRLFERQIQLLFEALEQGPSAAEHERVEHELVGVDQARLSQVGHERATAQDDHVRSGLLLQLSHAGGDVALE